MLAVALHDIEPATLARCREIRAWLEGQGIDRVTLLAIPANGGRPLQPGGELAAWLRDRRRRGDAVAQHGLIHAQLRRARGARQMAARWQGGRAAEFAGLGAEATVAALARGRGILRRAGLEPRGFVAPAYAYTDHLRRSLAATYAWWTDLVAVHGQGPSRYSPALCLGASTRLKRATSPILVRGLARVGAVRGLRGSLMRVDVHPVDFDHRRGREALELALARAAREVAVTYDELA
jgi:predicted deacetylase